MRIVRSLVMAETSSNRGVSPVTRVEPQEHHGESNLRQPKSDKRRTTALQVSSVPCHCTCCCVIWNHACVAPLCCLKLICAFLLHRARQHRDRFRSWPAVVL